MHIYMDHAATTPLDPEVLESMMPYFDKVYGNPSSIHKYGREAKAAVEKSRKTIAQILNTSPAQIFFTSGATESANHALMHTVLHHNASHIITSKLEHDATLKPIQWLEEKKLAKVHYVHHDAYGNIDLADLELKVSNHPHSLVAIMHANNEIGNINPVQEINNICKKYNCTYFCDTVQAMGYIEVDFKKFNPSFATASAHKFYGPKGIGFLYVHEDIQLPPYILGGSQERGMRAGTENTAGIVGICKALEISTTNMYTINAHLNSLKKYMMTQLDRLPDIGYNGLSNNLEKSISKILNVSFAENEKSDMLVFNLDIEKVAVSGGSACNSGALGISHVIEALHPQSRRPAIRFSFGKHNTIQEIDYVMDIVKLHQ